MAISSSLETEIGNKTYNAMMRDLLKKCPELFKEMLVKSRNACLKFEDEPYFGLLWADCVMNTLMDIYSEKREIRNYKPEKLRDFYHEWHYFLVAPEVKV